MKCQISDDDWHVAEWTFKIAKWFPVEPGFEFDSPSWPSLENILPELKTVLPNADFIIEGYVDPPSLRYGAASPLGEP